MRIRLILALTLMAAPALADDDFEKDLDAMIVKGGLTADQAAARAGAVSPEVHRKIAAVDASIAQVQASELQQVPIVKGVASYTRLSFISPVIFPFGGFNFVIPFLQNSYISQAQLAVPLSDYALRFPKVIAAARLGEDLARADKRSAEIGAAQDARVAYYEWLRSKLAVLVAQRQLTEVQTTLQQVRAFAEVQRMSRAELLRVESQEAETEQALDQLRNVAILREEQLRLLIGASPSEPLAIGEDIRLDLAAPTGGQLDDLVVRAQQKRPEFRVVDDGIAVKDKQREAEVANLLPHLSAFAIADYDNPNPRIFPQSDKFTFTWQAGVQLTWTINDALIERTTVRRLSAEADELRAERESLVRGTRIEVLAAQQAVQVAIRALQTSQKGLVAAEEGYRVRKELLDAQRATAVELVDAETALTQARINALNARVDLRVAIAQLAHAVGDDAGSAR